MRKNRLLILLSGLLISFAFAQDGKMTQRVIYKWQGDDGLIHYTHIKPNDISDFVQLDANGRKVEDYTEDFGEVVEIVVRPKSTSQPEIKPTTEEEERLAENRQKELKEKNCETARNNLKTLDTGEVYEQDSQGNMIRLSAEQVASKRKNVQRDIDYFCEPSSSLLSN